MSRGPAGLAHDAAPAESTGTVARALGARGSRLALGASDPAAELSPTAAAVLAAIPTWWHARASDAGLAGEWLDVHHAVAAEAPVSSLPDVGLDEAWGALSAEEVGATYAAALTPETRARHGRHYTPPLLAQRLWAMTRAGLGYSRRPTPLRGLLRDPACGCGALLLPPLREHLAANRNVDPSVVLAGISNMIEGVEADPAATWIANVVLAAELLPLLDRVPVRRRKPLPALVAVGDGLAPPARPVTAIVMNPPYGRVRLAESERARFASFLYGHANLYGLFMAAAVESLPPAGVLGALTPTSFTSGRYFTNLRAEIARNAPLSDITFVADRSGVFTSVLQETCLGVYVRSAARRTTISNLDSDGLHSVASVEAKYGGGVWVLPRRAGDAPLIAAAAAMPLTLGAAGWSASTGPLVWNRRKTDLHAETGENRAYVVWAADLDGGRLHRDPARDSVRFLSLRRPNDDRISLDSPAVLVQRTTAPEQRRRLVTAELRSADLDQLGCVVVENHVNVLRPRQDATLAISRSTLARVLATDTIDRLARCISGSVALSAYELESLPLPDRATLLTWETLHGEELERAVARAYRA